MIINYNVKIVDCDFIIKEKVKDLIKITTIYLLVVILFLENRKHLKQTIIGI